jgi:uncharacterized protein YdaL
MRVTIENVNRMVHELIPTKSDDYTWQVDDVKWTDSYYHFICERRNGTQKIDYVCKLSINRTAHEWKNSDGKALMHIYQIKIDDHPTIHYLHNNELKSMIEVMEKFADILKRIPK